jgi:hydrogenase nickel incorporation protein HypB
MCATCGCSEDTHQHGEHHHHHHHDHEPRVVTLEEKVLAKNDRIAAENRSWLKGRQVASVNLMSSPGAGKTTLLERTLKRMERPVVVIEGDQETARDAERVRAAGARAVQINTGRGCHLDAAMVAGAMKDLNPRPNSLLMIENVGNLVCPALFDLGEGARVVIASVTEGDDKPLKYPHMFRAASLMLISKIDLLPYVDFDVARVTASAREVNPGISILALSARTGEGMEQWYDWLRREWTAAGEAAFA